MWLELQSAGTTKLVNTKYVSFVSKGNDAAVNFWCCGDDGINANISIELHTAENCAAFIQGVILALNGMDFSMGEGDDFIVLKPLKDDANEALYKYMKLKELLGERK